MKANLASEFGPLFVNALARSNPQPYLSLLAHAIEHGKVIELQLYALYLQRGMTSRAQHYRNAIRKSPIYIDSMFDRVEQDPAAYLQ